jgi:hypothetical protein
MYINDEGGKQSCVKTQRSTCNASAQTVETQRSNRNAPTHTFREKIIKKVRDKWDFLGQALARIDGLPHQKPGELGGAEQQGCASRKERPVSFASR